MWFHHVSVYVKIAGPDGFYWLLFIPENDGTSYIVKNYKNSVMLTVQSAIISI
jgi:hypothetical protein